MLYFISYIYNCCVSSQPQTWQTCEQGSEGSMRRPGLRQGQDKDCFACDKKSFGAETTRDNASPLAQTEQADQAGLVNKQTGGLKGPMQTEASAAVAPSHGLTRVLMLPRSLLWRLRSAAERWACPVNTNTLTHTHVHTNHTKPLSSCCDPVSLTRVT